MDDRVSKRIKGKRRRRRSALVCQIFTKTGVSRWATDQWSGGDSLMANSIKIQSVVDSFHYSSTISSDDPKHSPPQSTHSLHLFKSAQNKLVPFYPPPAHIPRQLTCVIIWWTNHQHERTDSTLLLSIKSVSSVQCSDKNPLVRHTLCPDHTQCQWSRTLPIRVYLHNPE